MRCLNFANIYWNVELLSNSKSFSSFKLRKKFYHSVLLVKGVEKQNFDLLILAQYLISMPLKTSKNLGFSGFLGGYRNGKLG